VEDLIVDVPKDSTNVEKISNNPNPKVSDKIKMNLFMQMCKNYITIKS